MKYTYACKKVSLNDSIKAYTEKKIAKLEKYFREDTTAFVTFSVEKDHRCTVEITVRSGGALLRAQTEAPDGDMRGAVDAAVGYIERQILKNKTRLSKRLRSEGFPPPAPSTDFDVAEEKEFPVVRTKRFAVKPMSTEEAILQMNLLDHSFFVFRSSEDDSLCIVYRRETFLPVRHILQTPALELRASRHGPDGVLVPAVEGVGIQVPAQNHRHAGEHSLRLRQHG